MFESCCKKTQQFQAVVMMQQDRDLLWQQLSEAKDQESNSAKHMLHLMQRVNQVFVCVCVVCVCLCVFVCGKQRGSPNDLFVETFCCL